MATDPKGDRAARAAGLFARFPAVERLGALGVRARRVPFVPQHAAAECGAACLAMVLGYHGRATRLDEVRAVLGTGRDGTSAGAILRAARGFGLRARGVRLEVEDLECLEPGSVLHWDFHHFVVFERLRGEHVEILDPASGRRAVGLLEVRRSFTGVALLFEPAAGFDASARPGAAPAAAASTSRRLWGYLRDALVASGLWGRILVTSLLLQLFGLAVPALTGAVVDRLVPREDYNLLTVMAAGLAVLVAFHALAAAVRAHLLLHLRTVLEARMTLGFLDHLVRLPYAYFQQRTTGDLLTRLESNATIREMLTAGTLSAVLDGALVAAYLVVLFAASPSLGAVVLGLAVVQVALLLLTRRRQAELMARQLVAQAKQQQQQVELLAGMETLKAAGNEHGAVARWSDLFVDSLNVALERGRLAAAIEATTSTMRVAAPLVILAYGTLKVLGHELSLGAMLALSSIANGFLGPLGSLVSTAGQFQLLGSFVDRINDVLDAAPEQDARRVRAPGALRGEIALEAVSFRYAPGAPEVVRDVSLRVPAGRFVAIVGTSGSGKSTLAALMLGLYPPTAGRILLDGADLAELDLCATRQQVGIVTQRPYLFGSSVRANIAFGDAEVPLERVVDAARRACVHDEIAAMPMGYDTLVLEGGASLSGGQRQRLALARALVRAPRLLVLDEATSALDAVTERAVQRELARLDCTRVVIAHRLSTVRDADAILVMRDGALVEQGTHEELLARGGHYAELVAAQLSGGANASAPPPSQRG